MADKQQSYADLMGAHKAKLAQAAAKRDRAHEQARADMGRASVEHGEAVAQAGADFAAAVRAHNDRLVSAFYADAGAMVSELVKQPTRAGIWALHQRWQAFKADCEKYLGSEPHGFHMALVMAGPDAAGHAARRYVDGSEEWARATSPAEAEHAFDLLERGVAAARQLSPNPAKAGYLMAGATTAMAAELERAAEAERLGAIRNKHHLVPDRAERAPVAAKAPVVVDLGGLDSLPPPN